MDAGEQLKDDLRAGRLDANRLVDLLLTLQRELQAAKQRIAELETQLAGSSTAKVDEPFSLRAEEKRQDARGKKQRKAKPKGRRGRFTTADKVARAERSEDVVPDGVSKSECHLSHTRPVWRLENNRTVLIAYRIYRGPNNQYGKIPGVLGRSEFGLEIIVEIAHLVYVVGLSFDKVCLVLSFFQNLKLGKSQVDALLHRLSRHWQNEFDVLCTLLANSLVVHADETSWSLNSVWAFVSEKARLLFFGVRKDADTLKQILDPATFAGLVISDDAAVYANFTQSQKCWTHLLRKAIKLTLQEPNNRVYRRFTDRLLEIYHAACRVQYTVRRGAATRRWSLLFLGGGGVREGSIAFASELFDLFVLLLDLLLQQAGLSPPGLAAAREVADRQGVELALMASALSLVLPVVATLQQFGHPNVQGGMKRLANLRHRRVAVHGCPPVESQTTE